MILIIFFLGIEDYQLLIYLEKDSANAILLRKVYVISFNGEIYNYKELRKELFKKFKVNFDNTTDTQVVLEVN